MTSTTESLADSIDYLTLYYPKNNVERDKLYQDVLPWYWKTDVGIISETENHLYMPKVIGDQFLIGIIFNVDLYTLPKDTEGGDDSSIDSSDSSDSSVVSELPVQYHLLTMNVMIKKRAGEYMNQQWSGELWENTIKPMEFICEWPCGTIPEFFVNKEAIPPRSYCESQIRFRDAIIENGIKWRKSKNTNTIII